MSGGAKVGKLQYVNAVRLRSGKTTLVRRLAENHRPRPVYVVKGDVPPYPRVTWEDLERLTHATVIVEDFNRCQGEDKEAFGELCNRLARHQDLVVLVCFFMLNSKSPMYAFLPTFSSVYVMLGRGNFSSMQCLLRSAAANASTSESRKWKAHFQSKLNATYGYVQYSRGTGEFTLHEMAGDGDEEEEEGDVSLAEGGAAQAKSQKSSSSSSSAAADKRSFLKQRRELTEYSSLFGGRAERILMLHKFLFSSRVSSNILRDDLCVHLRPQGGRAKHRRVLRVSFLDYLHEVTSVKLHCVSPATRRLHKFFTATCGVVIPAIMLGPRESKRVSSRDGPAAPTASAAADPDPPDGKTKSDDDDDDAG